MFAIVIMPASMLFGVKSPYSSRNDEAANWVQAERAGHLLRQMRRLAFKTQKAVGPLQVGGMDLGWEGEAQQLTIARYDINAMGTDLLALNRMKNGLQPWQRRVLAKTTPEVHEMVYQMDQANREINANENSTALAMGQFPQNISMIDHQASRMASVIGTFTQYARAKQRLATLERRVSTRRG